MGKKTGCLALLAALAMALPASAQRGGWGGGGFRGGGHFGGGHFVGGHPGHFGGVMVRPGFGSFGHFGFGPRFVGGFGHVRFGAFFGGFGAPLIGYPLVVPAYAGYYPQQPTVIVIQQPAVEPQPRTVGSGPVVFQYEAPRAAVEAAPSPRLTLLVFKDHSIYAVTDYWVEGGRLHYITSYSAYNSMPLDQLDLDFTRRLNEERNVRFDLSGRVSH